MTVKKTMTSSSHLRTKSTFGAPITTMGQVCGHFTIQKIVRQARLLQAHQPKLTSPPLTLSTATLTRSDYCVKCFLGSGLQSQTTSYGWCSRKTWACRLLPSASLLSSFLPTFLSLPIQEDVPKKRKPPKSLWIKSLLMALNWRMTATTKMITNLRVRRRYRPQRHCTCGRRHQQKKPRHATFTTATCMSATWPNGWTTPQASNKQFDSDSHTLMLDDGASACITNCMDDFIESPKRVVRKVKGIKGHAKVTHDTIPRKNG